MLDTVGNYLSLKDIYFSKGNDTMAVNSNMSLKARSELSRYQEANPASNKLYTLWPDNSIATSVSMHTYYNSPRIALRGRKEGNVLFNDALNTFYLRLYGVGHMVKDHSDSERGNPLPPHGLPFPINSKGSFICTIPRTG